MKKIFLKQCPECLGIEQEHRFNKLEHCSACEASLHGRFKTSMGISFDTWKGKEFKKTITKEK